MSAKSLSNAEKNFELIYWLSSSLFKRAKGLATASALSVSCLEGPLFISGALCGLLSAVDEAPGPQELS